MPRSMTVFRETKLRALMERDGGVCHYCRREVRLRLHKNGDYRLDDATLDHKVPKSKGGTNDDDNLLLSCNECNNAKGDRSYEDFLERPYRLPPPKPALRRPRGYMPKPGVVEAAKQADERLREIEIPRATRYGPFARPRGETLPPDKTLVPAYWHTAYTPPQRMSALEVARFLREMHEKKGKPWPLA